MSNDILLSMAEDPTIRVPHPELPAVRDAAFEFAYASSALASVVFIDDESIMSTEIDNTSNVDSSDPDDTEEVDDTDLRKYGTSKGDVLEILTKGTSLGSVAIVYKNGEVEFIPPIRDEKRARRIREGLSRATNIALLESQLK